MPTTQPNSNTLMEKIMGDKKMKKMMNTSSSGIMLHTPFVVLDYLNGYKMDIYDNGEVIETRNETGICAGSIVTIIGKSATAKTTAAVQMAYSMVRQFDSGMVFHYDIEKAISVTRIMNITGMDATTYERHYVLKKTNLFIEDIMDDIYNIIDIKKNNKDEMMLDYGINDVFNKPIKGYPPTVLIIDSIPLVASRDAKEEMEGGTYSNRVAKALAQFFKKATPIIEEYNITIFVINHITTEIAINPMAKTAPQILYLKQGESLPGGKTPIYLSNNIFKFVAIGSEKYNMEDHGFDGFAVSCEVLKSRTNTNGKILRMIYNKESGFDPLRTLYQFAKDNELVDGRNPKKYIKGYPEHTFSEKTLNNDFRDNPELLMALITIVKPTLEDQLSYPSRVENFNNVGNEIYNLLGK